jgi:hypothetical protein
MLVLLVINQTHRRNGRKLAGWVGGWVGGGERERAREREFIRISSGQHSFADIHSLLEHPTINTHLQVTPCFTQTSSSSSSSSSHAHLCLQACFTNWVSLAALLLSLHPSPLFFLTHPPLSSFSHTLPSLLSHTPLYLNPKLSSEQLTSLL